MIAKSYDGKESRERERERENERKKEREITDDD